MRRRFALLTALTCMLGLIGQVFSNSRTDDPLGIAVSPQTLILSVDQGGAVTVHTAIPFAGVNTDALALNGMPAEASWPDSCGNLVARFSEQEIEARVAPPVAVLTLEGQRADGTPFAGSDEVRVIK